MKQRATALYGNNKTFLTRKQKHKAHKTQGTHKHTTYVFRAHGNFFIKKIKNLTLSSLRLTL